MNFLNLLFSMTRSILIFVGMFFVGALAALMVRAALFHPHAAQEAGAVGGGDYAPMVTNTLAPVPPTDASPPATPKAAPAPTSATPAKHEASSPAAVADASADKPVNTVCAMCGMDVDPSLPTAKYQGKTIGFGCRMCPPRFAKDPDRWGPLYLRNEVVKR